MTTPTSPDTAGHAAGQPVADVRGDDQAPNPFQYGHGRMPFFMKIVWLAFLGFIAWYIVTFLLASLAEEIA